MCSIGSDKLSNCTTDFNLTTDLEGNVLSYDELCFSNITSNENNYFIKNKITNLVVETNNFTNINIEEYNKTLNQLLLGLKPYMKYDERFTSEQFQELFNTWRNKTNENKKKRRNKENKDRLIVIDELDAKLHPKLLRYVIMLFKNQTINRHGAQLLFTSHDMSTMKNTVFRRDEIWFAAEDEQHQSKIYSLSDIRQEDNTRIKNTAAYDKQYLEGRYGADPYLSNMIGGGWT